MESLEFIAVIAVLAAILVWYLQNITRCGDGARGLLAMRADPNEADSEGAKRSYRSKSRIARSRQDRKTAFTQGNAANEAAHGEQMRRKFRRQDEARYRVKDRRPKDPDNS